MRLLFFAIITVTGNVYGSIILYGKWHYWRYHCMISLDCTCLHCFLLSLRKRLLVIQFQSITYLFSTFNCNIVAFQSWFYCRKRYSWSSGKFTLRHKRRHICFGFKNFNRAGSLRRLTSAHPRFWVFSDCTFLDNSNFNAFHKY